MTGITITLCALALLIFGHRQSRCWRNVRINRSRYREVVLQEAEGFDPLETALFMMWCDRMTAEAVYGNHSISCSYPSMSDYYYLPHALLFRITRGRMLRLSRPYASR